MEQKPAGTKIDVYLAASFLITVITITSSLPGTIALCLASLSQTKPSVKPLQGFSAWSKYTSQPGKARGIWLYSQPQGEEREKQREPAGKRQ